MARPRADRGDGLDAAIDRALARLVAGHGELGQAGAELAATLPDAVLARARYHGVLPLISARLDEVAADVPAWLADAARASVRGEVALDLARRPMVVEAIEALDRAGTVPIVLKGEALAHTLYAAPWMRPRADTDVLVAPDSEQRADPALVALGYRRQLSLPGVWVSSQASYVRSGPGGIQHAIDLHWRVNNSPVLAGIVSHGEIAASAESVPPLGPAARAPAPIHALLIACLHRVGSEHAPYTVDGVSRAGGDRLIWLADLDRLVRALSPADRETFVRVARERGAGRLCAAGIAVSAAAFATPGAPELARELSGAPFGSTLDRYLVAGPRGRAWLDFRALPGARARLAFLRETLWPDAAYLRARNPGSGHASPLRLRLARIARGAARRLR
jgi:hypothetical protein